MKDLIDKLSKKQLIWMCVSFIALLVTVIISILKPQMPTIVTIILVFVSQLASCFFFPIIVGYYIDKEKAKNDFGVINSFYQDFSEGGIIRVYKDREQSQQADNGLTALKSAFAEHQKGTVKLIGVTLRVFFNQTGPFYDYIEDLCQKSNSNNSIKIQVLINSEDAPETVNRGNIESPNHNPSTIITDMRSTKQQISLLNIRSNSNAIEYREYNQAPYCTAIIFPDKCFISQNLLCERAPVKLPLIIFKKDSHGYDVINDYFNYLWKIEEENNDENI